MNLSARRFLGIGLMITIIAGSIAWHQPINLPAVEVDSKPRQNRQESNQLFSAAKKLTNEKGRVASSIYINKRKVKIKRQNHLSLLCLNQGCVLMRDHSDKFKIILGPGARRAGEKFLR